MKTKVFLASAIAAIGLLGAGTTIGWSATIGSHHATTTKVQTMAMHSVNDMRAHMRAMHPSLSKSQLDRLVADCQKNGGSSMMDDSMMSGSNMMGGASMMGGTKTAVGHASHHTDSSPSGTGRCQH
jgi:hypothetical protein